MNDMTWWLGILAADEAATKNEDVGELDRALLRCVFCDGSVNLTTDRDLGRGGMLAWWVHRDSRIIGASGIYHVGFGPCLQRAESIGHLLDVHAEQKLGPKALPEIERIISTYGSRSESWDGAALRRLVQVGFALSRISGG